MIIQSSAYPVLLFSVCCFVNIRKILTNNEQKSAFHAQKLHFTQKYWFMPNYALLYNLISAPSVSRYLLTAFSRNELRLIGFVPRGDPTTIVFRTSPLYRNGVSVIGNLRWKQSLFSSVNTAKAPDLRELIKKFYVYYWEDPFCY